MLLPSVVFAVIVVLPEAIPSMFPLSSTVAIFESAVSKINPGSDAFSGLTDIIGLQKEKNCPGRGKTEKKLKKIRACVTNRPQAF